MCRYVVRLCVMRLSIHSLRKPCVRIFPNVTKKSLSLSHTHVNWSTSSAVPHAHAQAPKQIQRGLWKDKKVGLRESTHTWCCYIAVRSTGGRVNQKLKRKGCYLACTLPSLSIPFTPTYSDSTSLIIKLAQNRFFDLCCSSDGENIRP